MSLLSSVMLPIGDVIRQGIEEALLRSIARRDPFDAWILDSRPLTFGEFLLWLDPARPAR